ACLCFYCLVYVIWIYVHVIKSGTLSLPVIFLRFVDYFQTLAPPLSKAFPFIPSNQATCLWCARENPSRLMANSSAKRQPSMKPTLMVNFFQLPKRLAIHCFP